MMLGAKNICAKRLRISFMIQFIKFSLYQILIKDFKEEQGIDKDFKI